MSDSQSTTMLSRNEMIKNVLLRFNNTSGSCLDSLVEEEPVKSDWIQIPEPLLDPQQPSVEVSENPQEESNSSEQYVQDDNKQSPRIQLPSLEIPTPPPSPSIFNSPSPIRRKNCLYNNHPRLYRQTNIFHPDYTEASSTVPTKTNNVNLESHPTESHPTESHPEYKFKLFKDPNFVFGTLSVELNDIEDSLLGRQKINLDISCDNSGSMSDYCTDGRTKMHHVSHTIKNIVTSVTKQKHSITMSVHSFDDKLDMIFENETPTLDNMHELHKKVEHIEPRGMTDVYKSVETQKTRSLQCLEKDKKITQFNITLTDGYTNTGVSTKSAVIAKQIPSGCTNVFIGVGSEHSSESLQLFADTQPNGYYFYVAEIEKIGFVLGEIFHMMLYTALLNVTIEIVNGEIYDYKKNTWNNTITVSSLVYEAKKTYHVRSLEPSTVCVKIYAQSTLYNESEPTLVESQQYHTDTYNEEDVELLTYMLRQRTQDILFRAKQISSSNSNERFIENMMCNANTVEDSKKIVAIKHEMQGFLKFMKEVSKKYKMEGSEILNTLIEDISIVIQTFDSGKSELYINARIGSQGRQTSNTVTYIDPVDLQCPLYGGNTCLKNGLDSNGDDVDSFLKPPVLRREYTTSKQLQVMRDISGDDRDLDTLNVLLFPKLELPLPPTTQDAPAMSPPKNELV